MDPERIDQTRENLEMSAKGFVRAEDAIDLAHALGGKPTPEHYLALKQAKFYLHTSALVYADAIGTDRAKPKGGINWKAFKLLIGKR